MVPHVDGEGEHAHDGLLAVGLVRHADAAVPCSPWRIMEGSQLMDLSKTIEYLCARPRARRESSPARPPRCRSPRSSARRRRCPPIPKASQTLPIAKWRNYGNGSYLSARAGELLQVDEHDRLVGQLDGHERRDALHAALPARPHTQPIRHVAARARHARPHGGGAIDIVRRSAAAALLVAALP